MGFCETRLTNDIEHLFNIESYTRYSNNLSRHSGGVSLYIKDIFNSSLRGDLTVMEEFMETVFVEIDNNLECNIVVGMIYRRPNTNLGIFLNEFNNLISTISDEKKMLSNG